MQDELRPFGIQVQTINPGPFLTGFNETMVEAAYRWVDDVATFTPRAMVKEVTDGLLAKPEGRLDPNDMIAKMIELIPAEEGPFRNIFPAATQEWFRQYKERCSSDRFEASMAGLRTHDRLIPLVATTGRRPG